MRSVYEDDDKPVRYLETPSREHLQSSESQLARLDLVSAGLCSRVCEPVLHCCPAPSATFPASIWALGVGWLSPSFNCVGEADLKVHQLIGCKWVHLLWFGVAVSLQFSRSFYSFQTMSPLLLHWSRREIQICPLCICKITEIISILMKELSFSADITSCASHWIT